MSRYIDTQIRLTNLLWAYDSVTKGGHNQWPNVSEMNDTPFCQGLFLRQRVECSYQLKLSETTVRWIAWRLTIAAYPATGWIAARLFIRLPD